MKSPSNLPPGCTDADIERAADGDDIVSDEKFTVIDDRFTDDEKELIAEAMRMLWAERMERIAKNPDGYQPADVAILAEDVDRIRVKLGIAQL